MDLPINEFRKRILSLKDRAYEKGFIICGFLSQEYQEELKYLFKKNDYVNYYLYGGYQGSDYNRLIISTNDVDNNDFELTTLKINYSIKEGTFRHSDVLGSVLALGLKRDVVGDIVRNNNDYYIIVCSHVASFIVENLHYIRNVSCNLEYSSIDFTVKREYLNIKLFVNSMRLDLIASELMKLSRSKVLEEIKDSNIKVNHLVCNNNSKIVKENDIISIRGHGRFIVGNASGYTKSNNIILNIKKLIS